MSANTTHAMTKPVSRVNMSSSLARVLPRNRSKHGEVRRQFPPSLQRTDGRLPDMARVHLVREAIRSRLQQLLQGGHGVYVAGQVGHALIGRGLTVTRLQNYAFRVRRHRRREHQPEHVGTLHPEATA